MPSLSLSRCFEKATFLCCFFSASSDIERLIFFLSPQMMSAWYHLCHYLYHYWYHHYIYHYLYHHVLKRPLYLLLFCLLRQWARDIRCHLSTSHSVHRFKYTYGVVKEARTIKEVTVWKRKTAAKLCLSLGWRVLKEGKYEVIRCAWFELLTLSQKLEATTSSHYVAKVKYFYPSINEKNTNIGLFCLALSARSQKICIF